MIKIRMVLALCGAAAAAGWAGSLEAQSRSFYSGVRRSTVYHAGISGIHRPFINSVSGHVGRLNCSPFNAGAYGYGYGYGQSYGTSRGYCSVPGVSYYRGGYRGYASGAACGPSYGYGNGYGYGYRNPYSPYYNPHARTYRYSTAFVVGGNNNWIGIQPGTGYPRRGNLEIPWRIQMRLDQEAAEAQEPVPLPAPVAGESQQQAPPAEEPLPAPGAAEPPHDLPAAGAREPAGPSAPAALRRGFLIYPDTGEVVDGSRSVTVKETPAPKNLAAARK